MASAAASGRGRTPAVPAGGLSGLMGVVKASKDVLAGTCGKQSNASALVRFVTKSFHGVR